MSEIEQVDLEKKITKQKVKFRPTGIIAGRRVQNHQNNYRPFQRQYQYNNRPLQQQRYQYQYRPYRQMNQNQRFYPRQQFQNNYNQQNGNNRSYNRKSQSQRSEEREYKSKDPRPNVILKGLGAFITDAKLRELCQTYGPMDMCKLDRDSFGNVRPQGVGLVKYEKIEDAERMVKDLNGVKIVEDQDHEAGGQISVKLVNQSSNNSNNHNNHNNNNNNSNNNYNSNGVRRRYPFKQRY